MQDLFKTVGPTDVAPHPTPAISLRPPPIHLFLPGLPAKAQPTVSHSLGPSRRPPESRGRGQGSPRAGRGGSGEGVLTGNGRREERGSGVLLRLKRCASVPSTLELLKTMIIKTKT